jgi:hypothetical protein
MIDLLPVRIASALAGVVIAFSSARALSHHRAGRVVAGARWLAGGFLAVQLIVGLLLLPGLEPLKPVPAVAASVRQRADASVPVATFQFDEPSLVYYVRRAPVERLGSAAAVAVWARDHSPGILVTTRAALDTMIAATGPLPLHEFARAAGVDHTKGRPIEVVALSRGLR